MVRIRPLDLRPNAAPAEHCSQKAMATGTSPTTSFTTW